MALKLLHTSDWQVGKIFRFVDDGAMGLLQESRLAAITRIGELAVKHCADHILVAGDVYDMEALSPRSLNQPLERMRKFNSVQWHLLPGNHDSASIKWTLGPTFTKGCAGQRDYSRFAQTKDF